MTSGVMLNLCAGCQHHSLMDQLQQVQERPHHQHFRMWLRWLGSAQSSGGCTLVGAAGSAAVGACMNGLDACICTASAFRLNGRYWRVLHAWVGEFLPLGMFVGSGKDYDCCIDVSSCVGVCGRRGTQAFDICSGWVLHKAFCQPAALVLQEKWVFFCPLANNPEMVCLRSFAASCCCLQDTSCAVLPYLFIGRWVELGVCTCVHARTYGLCATQ